jgi:hypothetical protein
VQTDQKPHYFSSKFYRKELRIYVNTSGIFNSDFDILTRKIAKTDFILAQDFELDFNIFNTQKSKNPHYFSSKFYGK